MGGQLPAPMGFAQGAGVVGLLGQAAPDQQRAEQGQHRGDQADADLQHQGGGAGRPCPGGRQAEVGGAQAGVDRVDALQDGRGVGRARVGAGHGGRVQMLGFLLQSVHQGIGLAPSHARGVGHEARADPAVEAEHGRHVSWLSPGRDHPLLDLRQRLRAVLQQQASCLLRAFRDAHDLPVVLPVALTPIMGVAQQGVDGLQVHVGGLVGAALEGPHRGLNLHRGHGQAGHQHQHQQGDEHQRDVMASRRGTGGRRRS